MRRFPPLALALAWALAAALMFGVHPHRAMAQNPAPAGQPPMVAAGGVATLAVRKELVSDSLAFQVAPGPDARLFSAPRGWIRGDEGVGRLVVTLGVPATAIAGPVVLGTVTFGDGDVRTLEARVQTRRSAELLLDGDALTVPAGHGVAIGYRVRNLGNAPDTFSVALSAPSSWSADQRTTLIVPAGADSAGTFRFRLPRNARRGTEHQLRLTLVGTDIQSARSTRVIVVAEESRIGNLVTVPGSVFLGTSTGGSGTDGATPGVALTAGGEIRPGTTVRLAARHLETLTPAPAFRGMLAGPRLQLSIDAPDWNATLGDLYPSSELVPGHLTHGRGAEGAFRSGALSVRATIAAPRTSPLSSEDGHVAGAGVQYGTPLGVLGVEANSVDRSHDILGVYRTSLGAVTYAYRGSNQELRAAAGIARVSDGPNGATGPTARVQYTYRNGDLFLATRLRKVPGTTARTGQGDEAHVTGSIGIRDGVVATASGFALSSVTVGTEHRSTARGASAGLRLDLPRGATGRLNGSLRTSTGPGSVSATTRSVRVGADVPVAGVTLEGHLEAGRTLQSAERAFRQARVGARWSRTGQWGWVGVSHYDYGMGDAVTSLDIAASTRIGSADLQGGANARLGSIDWRRSTSVWAGVTAPIHGDTRLTAGAEYRGGSPGSPWRLSLGASRSFGLPLPVRRAPVVSGVVFEDLNGDGLQDPDETPLPGLVVTLGPLQATTDESGGFRFYEEVGGTLRLDQTTLPLGSRTPVAVEVDAGRADIPVTRTASLEIRVFLDRNGNQALDGGESYADGALVSVVDSRGQVRDAMADPGGRVRFDALTPGHYTVSILRPDGRSAPLEVDITLEPGAAEARTIALPVHQRRIRMSAGATPLFTRAGESPPSDPSSPLEQTRPADPSSGEDSGDGAVQPSVVKQPTPDRLAPTREPDAERMEAPMDGPGTGPTDETGTSLPAGSDSLVVAGAGTPGGQGTSGAPWWPGLVVALLLASPGVVAAGIRHAALTPATG